MAEYLAFRDGGKTDEAGIAHTLSKVIGGDVINGCQVLENSTPNMTVQVQVGDVAIDSGTGFRYCGWLDAVKSVTITTANASNPRKDLIVAYVDKSIVQSSTSNNVNALKVVCVAGTAGVSPVEPNNATIQTAIGATNPYIILALVDVPANDTAITNNQITDRRVVIPSLSELKTIINAHGALLILSGAVVSVVSGLNVQITAGTYTIGGTYVSSALVSSKALTASKDTYIDVTTDGKLIYTEVANGAASPALATGMIRIAKVVTAGASVTSIQQNGQDSIGNNIAMRSSSISTVGTAEILTAQSTASTTYTDLATVGPTVSVIVPPSGVVLVTITGRISNNSAGGWALSTITYSGANTFAGNDNYGLAFRCAAAADEIIASHTQLLTGLNPGLTTFKIQYRAVAGTATFSARKLTVIGI